MADDFAQSLFSELTLHRNLGLKLLRLEPDVEIELPVGDAVRGFYVALHGGAIAALIDVTAATAAALSDGFEFGRDKLVTLDMHVRYLGQPDGSVVIGRAKTVHRAGRVLHVDCTVETPAGKKIAAANLTYLLSTPAV